MTRSEREQAFLVADVGATWVRAAVARGGTLGEIVRRRVADLPTDPSSGIVDGIVAALAAARAAWSGPAPEACGIGIATVVDAAGSLQRSLAFGVPRGPVLRDRAAEALGVPVAVDNDANMAALGEAAHGAGRGRSDLVVVTLGTYIGMGVIAGGRLVHGARGGAGEIGEVLVPAREVDPGEAGPRAVRSERFGTGSTSAPEGYAFIEDLAGGSALSQALATARSAHGGVASKPPRVLREAAAGDPVALDVVRTGIEGWAWVVATAATVLDPEMVVISGGISGDLAPFLDTLRRRVSAMTRHEPEVVIGELGDTGGLHGAQEAARGLVGGG